MEYSDKNWSIAIASIAVAYVVCFFCWLLIDPMTPLPGCQAKPHEAALES
jgi:hypothetical protein